MAKKVFKVEQFEGGINRRSDARDIQPNQLKEAFNVDISNPGKVTTPGNLMEKFTTSNLLKDNISPNDDDHSLSSDTGITNGFGLFAFAHDYNIGNVTGSTFERHTEFLCINDGANIDIWDSSYNIGTGDTAWIKKAIRLGLVDKSDISGYAPDVSDESESLVKPIYYKALNGLRVCDANFGMQDTTIHITEQSAGGGETTVAHTDTSFETSGDISATITQDDIDNGANYIQVGRKSQRGGPEANDEIMKVIRYSGTNIVHVERGQLGTTAQRIPTASASHNSDGRKCHIWLLNIPKVLLHINRTHLKKARSIISPSLGTYNLSGDTSLQAWVHDVQALQAPINGKVKKVTSNATTESGGEATCTAGIGTSGLHIGWSVSGDSVDDGTTISSITSGEADLELSANANSNATGAANNKLTFTSDTSVPALAVYHGNLSSAAILGTDGTDDAIQLHQEPSYPERVLLSMHESDSGVDNVVDGESYVNSAAINNQNTVELPAVSGTDFAALGFATGTMVIIEGSTHIDGIAEIAGAGSAANKIKIFHSVPADAGTSAITPDGGYSIRLEANRISEDLQNKYIFGMSYLYDGGPGVHQESPITTGHIYSGIINHDAALFKDYNGWKYEDDNASQTLTQVTTSTTAHWAITS